MDTLPLEILIYIASRLVSRQHANHPSHPSWPLHHFAHACRAAYSATLSYRFGTFDFCLKRSRAYLMTQEKAGVSVKFYFTSTLSHERNIQNPCPAGLLSLWGTGEGGASGHKRPVQIFPKDGRVYVEYPLWLVNVLDFHWFDSRHVVLTTKHLFDAIGAPFPPLGTLFPSLLTDIPTRQLSSLRISADDAAWAAASYQHLATHFKHIRSYRVLLISRGFKFKIDGALDYWPVVNQHTRSICLDHAGHLTMDRLSALPARNDIRSFSVVGPRIAVDQSMSVKWTLGPLANSSVLTQLTLNFSFRGHSALLPHTTLYLPALKSLTVSLQLARDLFGHDSLCPDQEQFQCAFPRLTDLNVYPPAVDHHRSSTRQWPTIPVKHIPNLESVRIHGEKHCSLSMDHLCAVDLDEKDILTLFTRTRLRKFWGRKLYKFALPLAVDENELVGGSREDAPHVKELWLSSAGLHGIGAVVDFTNLETLKLDNCRDLRCPTRVTDYCTINLTKLKLNFPNHFSSSWWYTLSFLYGLEELSLTEKKYRTGAPNSPYWEEDTKLAYITDTSDRIEFSWLRKLHVSLRCAHIAMAGFTMPSLKALKIHCAQVCLCSFSAIPHIDKLTLGGEICPGSTAIALHVAASRATTKVEFLGRAKWEAQLVYPNLDCVSQFATLGLRYCGKKAAVWNGLNSMQYTPALWFERWADSEQSGGLPLRVRLFLDHVSSPISQNHEVYIAFGLWRLLRDATKYQEYCSNATRRLVEVYVQAGLNCDLSPEELLRYEAAIREYDGEA